VVSPGARYGPAKRWDPRRFAASAGRITTRLERAGVVLVGEGADIAACDQVADGIETEGIQLAGRTDLEELAGVLAGADAVLANDSGTAHLAAALGRPTVVIFGSTEPLWTAPRGERVAVARERVRCSPCFRRRCPLIDANACLRMVEPSAVVDAWAALTGREAV
jgi:heptosyltransferase-2